MLALPLILIIFSTAGCQNSTQSKAIEPGELSLANGDYKVALSLFIQYQNYY